MKANRGKLIEMVIAAQFRCYAGILHLRHGADPTKPNKKTNPGYAQTFEDPRLFLGRMAEAAAWSDLRGLARAAKPWMDGLPRLIFVSDMADALSSTVSFEYLRDEIIANVASPAGQRHIWLWLTKRPSRMAEFSRWLIDRGISWPDNLVAMTSVTSAATVSRVAQLREVKCLYRGLSVEPLWTPVTLPLEGISWCIVGGESGPYAKPFQLEWAYCVIAQCRATGVSPFVKQLGGRPYLNNRPYELIDSHGGDWDEWPMDLCVREFPDFDPMVKLPSGTDRLNPPPRQISKRGVMGRHKRLYDLDAIAFQANKILDNHKIDGRSLSVLNLAKMIRVRRNILESALDHADLMTLGQKKRDASFQSKVDKLPRIDLIGLHLQGAIGDTIKSENEPCLVVVYAFAYRGFPSSKIKQKRSYRALAEDFLMPSPISLDKMRICNFESSFIKLLNRQENHNDPFINLIKLNETIQMFSEFGKNSGYEVDIFLSLQGNLAPSVEDIRMSHHEKIRENINLWDKRPEQLVAMISTFPEIALTGGGIIFH